MKNIADANRLKGSAWLNRPPWNAHSAWGKADVTRSSPPCQGQEPKAQGTKHKAQNQGFVTCDLCFCDVGPEARPALVNLRCLAVFLGPLRLERRVDFSAVAGSDDRTPTAS